VIIKPCNFAATFIYDAQFSPCLCVISDLVTETLNLNVAKPTYYLQAFDINENDVSQLVCLSEFRYTNYTLAYSPRSGGASWEYW
jgi:hypothetical protein